MPWMEGPAPLYLNLPFWSGPCWLSSSLSWDLPFT